MKIALVVLTVLIALLSLAAGIAKIMLVPDELLFLSGFGFSEIAVVIYGGIQILGGVLFVVPISSIVGAILVILAFSLSTVLLFFAGDVAFAIFSALPILLTVFVVFHKFQHKLQTTEVDA